ncbi:N-acetylmuramoyl-L-alanine amidase family protein [Flagellimonas pacifica]|uniref:N-acetylmuramoyl-L-alanine amidase n=1 Tax=Flagellimonas pacifica TaxID=1247520 RepID=A0A285MS74_9FLAO|nr:N-acetylmuramoyl-L-alanine amidase [Allomuricauda parva]SNY99533.1 N-acetylmuramoyl-L-alanine amidase [Allomuricauda parva]
MKSKRIIWLCLFIWTMVLTVGIAQEREVRPIIVIDPGHGGTDTGATSIDASFEKDIVFQLSQQILVLNRTVLEDPLQLYLTRYSDTLISLKDRGRLSHSLKADLFISLHGNHAPNPEAQGLEVFVWRPFSNAQPPFRAASVKLAETIAVELHQQLDLKYRGIKQANFQVLRDNRLQCPAVLLELGFLSNGEESNYLKSERGIRAMALAILMAISKYLRDVGAH